MAVLVATGLHLPVRGRELVELLGADILSSFKVLNHDARDPGALADLGEETSFGTPVEVNRMVLEADLALGLGLIEPHFFAGYSGGRKILLPGVAGERAVFANHGYGMIAHPRARAGVLEGNPIHEDMLEFMEKAGLDFILNVTLNKEGEVTGVFAGDPVEAHLEGVKRLDGYVRAGFGERADIVVTTNGGYPLDRDLYQAVKGLDTASMVVREGGVIVIASECVDGLGGHEHFLRLVRGCREPGEILERIRAWEPVPDQWQAQVLARVLERAHVILVSDNVGADVARDMLMEKAGSLEEALRKAYERVGGGALVAAIPEGPYIIPEYKGGRPPATSAPP